MGLFNLISEVCDWFAWLASPCVIPWAGAVAAIIAALTIEPKTWLKSPLSSVGRVLRVAAIWLLVAWMLSSAARLDRGRGSGAGVGNGSGTGKANDTPRDTPAGALVPGQFPPGTPEDVDLIVTFVPSPVNQTIAQDFACDLLWKSPEKKARRLEIRAGDMHEFDKLLVQQLRDLNLPEAPNLRIERSPFPGENVVRRIADKVRAVYPNAHLVFR